MKSIILIAIFTTFTALAFTSCEKETCKECRIVTYEGGNKVSESAPDTYCGSQLASVEGETATVGDRTTVIVCN